MCSSRNRAICIQPPLMVTGYIMLKLSASFLHQYMASYYVETPATATQKIFFDDLSYYQRSPWEIGIMWEHRNLTVNRDVSVSISLWGYKETTGSPSLSYITQLATNVPNKGWFKILPSEYKDRDDGLLTDMKFGFIQINLTKFIPIESREGPNRLLVTPLIWSRPIPLGWYFEPQWQRKYGQQWPKVFCDEWLQQDTNLNNFTTELPECPCTLKHALADKGRFMPDLECDKDSNPNCYIHRRALHCAKSGLPTSQGAEQQCCYDLHGFLMLSYDKQWASFPRRSHNLGSKPTLAQWYRDMVPRMMCCLWQEEDSDGCRAFRYVRRPTQDCVGYQSPGIAGVYGSHIITFDDVEYLFNGKGEFILVQSLDVGDQLEVQGRFEQMPATSFGEVKATELTAVVVKSDAPVVIEVRRTPKWRYHLDVLYNGKTIYFDKTSMKFQHFSGVTVYTPTYIFDQSEVVIMLASGAGVQIVENNGHMSARVYLPRNFINQTRGLLGTWNFDSHDDFTLPNGTRTGICTDLNDKERLFYDFSLKWIVNDNTALFAPEFRTQLEELIPVNQSAYRIKALEFCTTENYSCLYDYALTYNKEFAHFSSHSRASIMILKDTNRRKVVSCGGLRTPKFGRKITFSFTPGAPVIFECIQNYTLVGDRRREYLPSGQWDIPTYGYTKCLLDRNLTASENHLSGTTPLTKI